MQRERGTHLYSNLWFVLAFFGQDKWTGTRKVFITFFSFRPFFPSEEKALLGVKLADCIGVVEWNCLVQLLPLVLRQ